MKIVYMGTPEIAKVCLEKLYTAGFDIAAVYTKPDTPKNRGMKMMASEVKRYAESVGLPVIQPVSFRDDAVVEELRAIAPDLIVVVAYGKILPQRVLDIPKYGCINIHASLLPKYRGSAPYQWAVLDGLKETGVTAMYLCREMDAGDMIDQVRTPIGPEETAGELLDRLAVLGADLLSRTLRKIEAGTVTATPQDPAKVTYAPMLDKSMCPIDFTKSAAKIHDQVRGLHPWPVATAELAGRRFKIHACVVAEGSGAPGTILGLTKTGLLVACGEGAIEIRRLQADGGKPMAATDYFRGHPLEG